jgi:hypothetical protein
VVRVGAAVLTPFPAPSYPLAQQAVPQDPVTNLRRTYN